MMIAPSLSALTALMLATGAPSTFQSSRCFPLRPRRAW